MIKKKVCLDLNVFPVEITEYIRGREVFDTSCRSGCTTYYLKPGYYLKVGPKGSLIKEAQMTERFHKLGFGPKVDVFMTLDRDYMVTEEVLGDDMLGYLDQPEHLCRILAEALRELHSNPANDIPVSAQIGAYRALASKTLPEDASYFIQRAMAFISENIGLLGTDTLIHGDACLPNVILKDGHFSSFIDFDAAGAGDKHIDLWWAMWSLNYNLQTDKYSDMFLR